MTIQDDIDALLPDNNTGLIDASTLRAAFKIAVDAGILVEARVVALEASGGEISYGGIWQYNPVAGAAPQTMQIAFDTGVLANATWIRLWPIDRQTIDMSLFITTASRIYVQEKVNSNNMGYYDVTGAITLQDGYYQAPVSYRTGKGDSSSAQWQEAVVVFTMPSA